MEQAALSQMAAVAGGTSLSDLDRQMWEILKFLWSCPNRGKEHPYRMKYVRIVQENVIEALTTGQYVLFRDENGAIQHFIAYWIVPKEDIDTICQGIKPAIRWAGDTMYIVDHGNKGGRRSLTKMIIELKHRAAGNRGVFWHSWNRKRFRMFLEKKGV